MHRFQSARRAGIALTALSLCAVAPVEANRAGPVFEGPVEARVLSVLDGDTFVAEAHVWPGQFVRVNVRIRGIDAPEMKSRCLAEQEAAVAARDLLSNLLGNETVAISNIGGAKYYGRVLADVVTERGEPVSQVLVDRGLARPYRGGKRQGWCDLGE